MFESILPRILFILCRCEGAEPKFTGFDRRSPPAHICEKNRDIWVFTQGPEMRSCC